MKFVTYLFHEPLNDYNEPRLGLLVGEDVVDLEHASSELGTPLPHNVLSFLRLGEPAMAAARKVDVLAKSFGRSFVNSIARFPMTRTKFLAPVPRPT
jgi:hypothetical protein